MPTGSLDNNRVQNRQRDVGNHGNATQSHCLGRRWRHSSCNFGDVHCLYM